MQQTELIKTNTPRICLLRDGHLEPRFASPPLLSGAWNEMLLERHCLQLDEGSTGVIEGCLLCFNIGSAATVHWQTSNGRISQSVGKSELVVASDGQMREASWHSRMDLLLCWLSPKMIWEFGTEHSNGSMLRFAERRGFRDPQIETLLRMLYEDVRAGMPAGPIYGEQLGSALTVYLARRYAETRPDGPSHQSALPGVPLKRVCEYIETHLGDSITLDRLSAEARLSRFYFARLFRNATGESPAVYVTNRRIARAKELLATSGLDLREIARLTGFSSHSHFASIFRRRTGATPSRYRSLRKSGLAVA